MLKQLLSLSLPKECSFDEFDLVKSLNAECGSLILSKFVGIGLILFSSFVKIPQIWRIIRHKRADGISIVSILMEIPVNAFSFAYHRANKYPITTYGETFVVFFQNVLIGFSVTHLEKNISPEIWNFFLLPHFLLVFGTIRDVIPLSLIDVLWMICIPLSILNKIPQIILTYTQNKRGNYSRLSAFLRSFGSLCRVFTTFKEISDITVKISSLINLILTVTIFVQSIIYPIEKEEKLL